MIRSSQNETLKELRRLLRSKGTHAVLEGPHLLEEALRSRVALREVFATPEFTKTAEGERLTARLHCALTMVEARLLDALADADSPRGVLALADLPRGGVESLPVRPGGVYVLAEGLQDPGNLGALARTAEAAGAAGLALTPGSCNANHPRALRASAGSLLRLPVAQAVEPEALAERLDVVAPQWLALAPRAELSLYRAALDGAIVLLIGAEGPGISSALMARATLAVRIPVAAEVESLNATVAAAVALFEIARRRRSKAAG